MKLAEALIERKELKASIAKAQGQVAKNFLAIVDEGEGRDGFDSVIAKMQGLEQLERKIRETNATESAVIDGVGSMTIADAIAARDSAKGQLATIKTFLDIAGKDGTTSEATFYQEGERKVRAAKMTTQVSRKELTAMHDEKASMWRKLDVGIQAANWATDLAGN